MLGAIVGDVVGSTREFHPIKTKAFDLLTPESHITDDTVLTIAVAMAAAGGRDLSDTLRDYSRRHVVSYGLSYWSWVGTPSMRAYGSWSNGAAMRVSSAAWLASHPAEVLRLARWSAEVTHDHPEAVRAAEAVALAVHLARSGCSVDDVRRFVSAASGYDLSRDIDSLRGEAQFECKAWISVPRAIICALDSDDFEDAIRNAVSLGGDADTEGAIAGAIAEPLHGIPSFIETDVLGRLPDDLRRDLQTLRSAIVPPAFDPSWLGDLRTWDPECVEAWKARRRPVPIATTTPAPPSLRRRGGLLHHLKLLFESGRRHTEAVSPAPVPVPHEVAKGREALDTYAEQMRLYGWREGAVRRTLRLFENHAVLHDRLVDLISSVAAVEAYEGRDPVAFLQNVHPSSPNPQEIMFGFVEYAEIEMIDVQSMLADVKARIATSAG